MCIVQKTSLKKNNRFLDYWPDFYSNSLHYGLNVNLFYRFCYCSWKRKCLGLLHFGHFVLWHLKESTNSISYHLLDVWRQVRRDLSVCTLNLINRRKIRIKVAFPPFVLLRIWNKNPKIWKRTSCAASWIWTETLLFMFRITDTSPFHFVALANARANEVERKEERIVHFHCFLHTCSLSTSFSTSHRSTREGKSPYSPSVEQTHYCSEWNCHT